MKIPKLARRQAKERFRECLVNGRLDENRARQVMQSMAAEKPRGFLAILTHFHRLVKLEMAKRTARIESAAPLSPDLQNNVLNSLSRLYGPGLYTSFSVRPDLIGGMRIQVGSDVYDGSILARLSALEEDFA